MFPLDEADQFDARQRLIRALAQSKLKRLEDEIRAAVRADAIQSVTADRWAQAISQIRESLYLDPPPGVIGLGGSSSSGPDLGRHRGTTKRWLGWIGWLAYASRGSSRADLRLALA